MLSLCTVVLELREKNTYAKSADNGQVITEVETKFHQTRNAGDMLEPQTV